MNRNDGPVTSWKDSFRKSQDPAKSENKPSKWVHLAEYVEEKTDLPQNVRILHPRREGSIEEVVAVYIEMKKTVEPIPPAIIAEGMLVRFATHEPTTNQEKSIRNDDFTSSRYGALVSKERWHIVLKKHATTCMLLPITTRGGRGFKGLTPDGLYEYMPILNPGDNFSWEKMNDKHPWFRSQYEPLRLQQLQHNDLYQESLVHLTGAVTARYTTALSAQGALGLSSLHELRRIYSDIHGFGSPRDTATVDKEYSRGRESEKDQSNMSIVETTPVDDHDERCVDDTNRKSCHIAANVGIPSSTNYVPSLAPIEPLFTKQQEYELECGTVCDFGELRHNYHATYRTPTLLHSGVLPEGKEWFGHRKDEPPFPVYKDPALGQSVDEARGEIAIGITTRDISSTSCSKLVTPHSDQDLGNSAPLGSPRAKSLLNSTDFVPTRTGEDLGSIPSVLRHIEKRASEHARVGDDHASRLQKIRFDAEREYNEARDEGATKGESGPTPNQLLELRDKAMRA
jgi:hypothetical protein